MSSNLNIKIKDFRAINNANIAIDGITLVAGENGCGKSTLSKLLYYLFKTISNYDVLIKEKLVEDLRDYFRFIEIFQQQIYSFEKDRAIRNELEREIDELQIVLFFNKNLLDDEFEQWKSLLNKIEFLYKKYLIEPNFDDRLNSRIKRTNRIISDLLETEIYDYEDSIKLIEKQVESKYKEALGKVKSRPRTLFNEQLHELYPDSELPKEFEVREYEDVIVSLTKLNLAIPYSIIKSIYIDTPMMISVEDNYNKHWTDLNHLISDESKNNNKYITDIISRDIINGDVECQESFFSEEFKFKRVDGRVFNLLDVATGIKSFSILQLLLKNGHLNDKTLLIIDEPESNLHPQWIVEYARIIVLLNKLYKVKFFIASHNPDMVSAIRYISEKQGILPNVNFYLAEKKENPFLYDYKFLDKEIDPIFESFNISIDRINQYGV
ncbi:MAG: AAA family ATPase [Flavobacteriaceae bacterium]|nr:AAA family ATPase [Flavobacteriaceae bacterium]